MNSKILLTIGVSIVILFGILSALTSQQTGYAAPAQEPVETP